MTHTVGHVTHAVSHVTFAMQAIGSYGAGLIDIEELGDIERCSLPGSGSCGNPNTILLTPSLKQLPSFRIEYCFLNLLFRWHVHC